MRRLAEQYLAARGLRRRIWNAPLPRRVRTALDAGDTSPDALHGATTWTQWLARSSTVAHPAVASSRLRATPEAQPEAAASEPRFPATTNAKKARHA